MVAKFSVFKSHKLLALGIVFGLAVAAYSCAASKDAGTSATADASELFAPVFLTNLESALTLSKVSGPTVSKIMSEIPSPSLAFGLTSSSEMSTLITSSIAAVVSNVPALTAQTVTAFIAIVAQSVAQVIGAEAQLTAALLESGVAPPTPVVSENAVAAAVVVVASYIANPQYVQDFFTDVGSVDRTAVDRLCEETVDGSALSLGNPTWPVVGAPGTMTLKVDGALGKCLYSTKDFCHLKEVVGDFGDNQLKTFDVSYFCESRDPAVEIRPFPSFRYPPEKLSCAVEADRVKIKAHVIAAVAAHAETNCLPPIPSLAPVAP